jgi:hypothetical protein
MTEFDRRTMLRGLFVGTAAVAAGLTIMPTAAEAVPLAGASIGAADAENLVENAQVVIEPRRRVRRRGRPRRRLVCRWRRGRRVCWWERW